MRWWEIYARGVDEVVRVADDGYSKALHAFADRHGYVAWGQSWISSKGPICVREVDGPEKVGSPDPA